MVTLVTPFWYSFEAAAKPEAPPPMMMISSDLAIELIVKSRQIKDIILEQSQNLNWVRQASLRTNSQHSRPMEAKGDCERTMGTMLMCTS